MGLRFAVSANASAPPCHNMPDAARTAISLGPSPMSRANYRPAAAVECISKYVLKSITMLTRHSCKLVTVSCILLAASAFSANARQTISDLTLTDLTGKKVHLRDYRGKIVVLNFWATWCAPCREEMPLLVEAEKTWGPKGVLFIGASLDDNKTRKNIPEFVQRFRIDFPVWTGATADDLAKLKMGDAVPDTAFLDEQGVIFARVRGEIRKQELDERLTWITGDRSGPAPQPLVIHLNE